MKKLFIAGGFFALSLIFSGPMSTAEASAVKPFDGAELEKFIADYPGLTQWSAPKGQVTGNLKNHWVMAGMQYNPAFAKGLKEKGWESDRFFYLLNHVRQGVMAEEQRQRQEESEAAIDRQMAEMAAKLSAQHQAFEKERQEQAQRAEAWIKDQLEAQKKQVRENRFMHPLQKKNILDFLEKSSAQANQVEVTPFDFEQARAEARERQKAWEARYRQSIQDNPHIPAEQKKRIMEGLDLANQPVKPQAAVEPVKMPTQEEMMVRMQEQRKGWVARNIEQIEKNSGYSDEQKRAIINRLNHFSAQMGKEPSKNSYSALPEEEMALIRTNIKRLQPLLQTNP
ncbi:MAG: hypothetical protein HQL72_07560 [Magnetococcales bacterium]|nr:hypothetical protein [Magnetococcales bacterium]